MALPRDPLAGTEGAPPPAAEQSQAAAIAAPAALAPRLPASPPAPQFSPAELEARRERAALLRAYEGSTLTRANFCVLKRISEADLQAQLALAGQERAQQPRPEPHHAPRAESGGRRDERGPRPDRSEGGSARGPRSPQSRPPGRPPR